MAGERVVVIGGGITGTLTAWRLQRAGFRVQLVEARHIGAGSSSRTAAGIRQQFSTAETVLGMRYSVDFYLRFGEEVGGGRCPIVQNGYLFLLDEQQAVERARDRVALQRSLGLREVELLDAQQAALAFPWLDPAAFLAATWCPTDGFLRPELVYNEAAAAARALGAEIVQGAPVEEARRGGGRLLAVRAGGEWREADLFVDASNAWTPRLARLLGGTELPVAPLKRYLWFLERGAAVDPQVFAGMPLVITPGGVYFRPESEDSLLVGWAHATRPEPFFSHEDQDRVEPAFDHRQGAESPAVAAWMQIAAQAPVLGELAGLRATTSGYYGSTPDHNPFLGFDPAVDNLIRLVGFSGHGAMFGPFSSAVGLALAQAGRDLDQITVLDRPVSLAPFRLDRPPGHAETLVI